MSFGQVRESFLDLLRESQSEQLIDRTRRIIDSCDTLETYWYAVEHAIVVYLELKQRGRDDLALVLAEDLAARPNLHPNLTAFWQKHHIESLLVQNQSEKAEQVLRDLLNYHLSSEAVALLGHWMLRKGDKSQILQCFEIYASLFKVEIALSRLLKSNVSPNETFFASSLDLEWISQVFEKLSDNQKKVSMIIIDLLMKEVEYNFARFLRGGEGYRVRKTLSEKIASLAIQWGFLELYQNAQQFLESLEQVSFDIDVSAEDAE